nr:putative quinol monooxygenase [uncultured Neokomagataea sp.]
MTQAVHVVAVVTVAPEKAPELQGELARCLRDTHKEAGCVSYTISRDLEKIGRFTAVEEWASREAFEAHLQTPHFQALAALSQTLDAQLDVMQLQPLEAAP